MRFKDGIYFFAIGMEAYALLAFSLAGSLIAFLIFNHHPAKIFMGDSGSLMIGLVNSILVIKFITVADSSTVSFPVTTAISGLAPTKDYAPSTRRPRSPAPRA